MPVTFAVRCWGLIASSGMLKARGLYQSSEMLTNLAGPLSDVVWRAAPCFQCSVAHQPGGLVLPDQASNQPMLLFTGGLKVVRFLRLTPVGNVGIATAGLGFPQSKRPNQLSLFMKIQIFGNVIEEKGTP